MTLKIKINFDFVFISIHKLLTFELVLKIQVYRTFVHSLSNVRNVELIRLMANLYPQFIQIVCLKKIFLHI